MACGPLLDRGVVLDAASVERVGVDRVLCLPGGPDTIEVGVVEVEHGLCER